MLAALQSRRLRQVLYVLAIAFFLVRFTHLSADYPRAIRWDDAAATDEGWYASSAINQHLWGTWLLPGDMNNSVVLPVWPVMASIAFHLAGFGITTLRGTGVLSFIACSMLLCLLLRRLGGALFVPLFALMLAVNPWAFAFSRTGLLEFPMLLFFAASALILAPVRTDSNPGLPLWQAILAGGFFALSLLTKTTAAALAPSLLVLLLARFQNRIRPALLAALPVFLTASGIYAAFWMLHTRRHPQDLALFLSVNPSNFHWRLYSLAAETTRPLRYGLGADHLLFTLSAVVIAASILLPRLRPLWKQPLFAFGAVWFLGLIAFMVQRNNAPVRYFAALIPAALLIGIALLLPQAAVLPRLRKLFALLIAADIALNTLQTGFIALHPTYSLRDAAQHIAAAVHNHPEAGDVLLADNAHLLALYTGLRPVNVLFHSAPMPLQMQRYQPGWYAQLAPADPGTCLRQVLQTTYATQPQGSWQLSYPAYSLTLYRLQHIPGKELPAELSADQTAACLQPVYLVR